MKPSTERVLRLLQESPQTTATFAEAHCPRASARILELRDLGHRISSERITRNHFRYTLLPANPEPMTWHRNFTDPDDKWKLISVRESRAA